MALPVLGAIGLGAQIFGMGASRRASKRARRAEREAAKRAKEAGEFAAQQYEDKAQQEMAIGSREAEEARRQGKTVASDARAIGAASGAGGYESVIAEIEGESDYHMLTALYNRKQSARDLEVAAEVSRREGADAARGHVAAAGAYRSQARSNAIQGGVNFLDGAMTMYERYGQPYVPAGGFSAANDQANNSLNGYRSVRSVA